MNITGNRHKLTADGLFLAESGTQHAQSILFLHSSGSNSGMWTKHFAVFEKSFHCIAPDFPGHGKSNSIAWTTIDETTDSIAKIIKNKCRGSVNVVGVSLGGSIIYRLMEKYPELIDKVIIDGASPVPIKGHRLVIFGVTVTSPLLRTGFMIKMMAKGLKVLPEEFDSFKKGFENTSPKSFRRAMVQANRLKSDIDSRQVKIPAFFVSGETESETMHRFHQKFAEKIPGSECAVYPQKGHAWLVEDIETHIELLRYWFFDGEFPVKLRRIS
ncbi:MAG TPA: alpha/beta hydrolase [Prolixibacteraceae bacterium]|nr:alpha/beta hydrolase [Prolixibacteraceae bacterium]